MSQDLHLLVLDRDELEYLYEWMCIDYPGVGGSSPQGSLRKKVRELFLRRNPPTGVPDRLPHETKLLRLIREGWELSVHRDMKSFFVRMQWRRELGDQIDEASHVTREDSLWGSLAVFTNDFYRRTREEQT